MILKQMKNNYIRSVCMFGVALFCGGMCHGKSVKAQDFFTSKLQIALAEAVAGGDTATIARLVADGVDVNATGRAGMTPIVWSLVHLNKKGFSFLLKIGANPNAQLTETLDDIVTAGTSAISLASKLDDSWYLRQVLANGGNPNIVNPVNTLTPIFESISSSRLDNVKLLIAAKANLNYQDKNGVTPAFSAAIVNSYEIVYWILDAGANPSIPDKWGNTILYSIKNHRIDSQSSAYKWKQKVIVLLRERGVDIEHGK